MERAEAAALLAELQEIRRTDPDRYAAIVADVAAARRPQSSTARGIAYARRVRPTRASYGPPRCGSCGCPPEDHVGKGPKTCDCGRCGGWQGR